MVEEFERVVDIGLGADPEGLRADRAHTQRRVLHTRCKRSFDVLAAMRSCWCFLLPLLLAIAVAVILP